MRKLVIISVVSALSLLGVVALAANTEETNLFSPQTNASVSIATYVASCAQKMMDRAAKSGVTVTKKTANSYSRGCSCLLDWRRSRTNDKVGVRAAGGAGVGQSCGRFAQKSAGNYNVVVSPYSTSLDLASEAIFRWTIDCWRGLRDKRLSGYQFSSRSAALTCGCLMDGVRAWPKNRRRSVITKINGGQDILVGMSQREFNICFQAHTGVEHSETKPLTK